MPTKGDLHNVKAEKRRKTGGDGTERKEGVTINIQRQDYLPRSSLVSEKQGGGKKERRGIWHLWGGWGWSDGGREKERGSKLDIVGFQASGMGNTV